MNKKIMNLKKSRKIKRVALITTLIIIGSLIANMAASAIHIGNEDCTWAQGGIYCDGTFYPAKHCQLPEGVAEPTLENYQSLPLLNLNENSTMEVAWNFGSTLSGPVQTSLNNLTTCQDNGLSIGHKAEEVLVQKSAHMYVTGYYSWQDPYDDPMYYTGPDLFDYPLGTFYSLSYQDIQSHAQTKTFSNGVSIKYITLTFISADNHLFGDRGITNPFKAAEVHAENLIPDDMEIIGDDITFILEINEPATVTVKKEWNDDKTGTEANNRDVPRLAIQYSSEGSTQTNYSSDNEWVKDDDDSWTYVFDVPSDAENISVWEDYVPSGYESSVDQFNQATATLNGQVQITNTQENEIPAQPEHQIKHSITVGKEATGGSGRFQFKVKVWQEGPVGEEGDYLPGTGGESDLPAYSGDIDWTKQLIFLGQHLPAGWLQQGVNLNKAVEIANDALDENPSTEGSVSGQIEHEGSPVSGVQFGVFKMTNYSNSSGITLKNDLQTMDGSSLIEIIETLASSDPMAVVTSGSNGKATLNNVEPGLYLFMPTGISQIGSEDAIATPFITSFPHAEIYTPIKTYMDLSGIDGVEGGGENEYTFYVNSGETFTLPNIPKGYKYKITEVVPEGWSLVSIDGENKTTAEGTLNEDVEHTFKNKKKKTGILRVGKQIVSPGQTPDDPGPEPEPEPPAPVTVNVPVSQWEGIMRPSSTGIKSLSTGNTKSQTRSVDEWEEYLSRDYYAEDRMQETVSYDMTALSADNPMPNGAQGSIYRFTLNGNANYWRGWPAASGTISMTYSMPGDYAYMLETSAENYQPPWYEYSNHQYDPRTYILAVHIENAGGNLVASYQITNTSTNGTVDNTTTPLWKHIFGSSGVIAKSYSNSPSKAASRNSAKSLTRSGGQTFNFTVSLEGLDPNETYAYYSGQTEAVTFTADTNGEAVVNVSLGDSDEIWMELPEGATYVVTEKAHNGWKGAFEASEANGHNEYITQAEGEGEDNRALSTAEETVTGDEDVTFLYKNSEVEEETMGKLTLRKEIVPAEQTPDDPDSEPEPSTPTTISIPVHQWLGGCRNSTVIASTSGTKNGGVGMDHNWETAILYADFYSYNDLDILHQLKASNASNPMPEGTQGDAYTFTLNSSAYTPQPNKASARTTLEMTYTQAGDYEYTLKALPDEDQPAGHTSNVYNNDVYGLFDPHEYIVTVHVEDSSGALQSSYTIKDKNNNQTIDNINNPLWKHLYYDKKTINDSPYYNYNKKTTLSKNASRSISDSFSFTIVFGNLAPNTTYEYTFGSNTGSFTSNAEGEATEPLNLGDADEVTFILPAGATYIITEGAHSCWQGSFELTEIGGNSEYIEQAQGTGEPHAALSTAQEVVTKGEDVLVLFKNKKSIAPVSLPVTGAKGVMTIIVVGLLIIILSAILLERKKKH